MYYLCSPIAGVVDGKRCHQSIREVLSKGLVNYCTWRNLQPLHPITEPVAFPAIKIRTGLLVADDRRDLRHS